MEVVVMPSPWRWSHSPAPVPGGELVAVHPVFFLPIIIPVDPAAISVTLAVATVSVPARGAFLPDPLAVALFNFVLMAPIPCIPLVAADPPVIAPVVVGLWGVPPAAVIGAPVILVVGPGALLPDPIVVAVVVAG